MAERMPPSDIEAERAVLGACVLAREACEVALPLLTASDFYKPLHGHIFAAITQLVADGEEVNALTVGALTERFDPTVREQLIDMATMTPSVSSPKYANTVLAHAKSRQLLALAAELTAAAYDQVPAAQAADYFAGLLSDHELLHRNEAGTGRGYYRVMRTIDAGGSRDNAQPWISRGVLRRGQRMLIVARAGLGKSVLLRQLAFCAVNGVHVLTGQPTEYTRNALIVELEAGEWDIAESMRTILFALQDVTGAHSVHDLAVPSLLHRPGGINLREPDGVAALESAIQDAQPEVVCMGPIKYMSIAQPGENYEIAALRLMNILNDLISRYRFGLAMEAHFSRGDHGAPGGSERWVDWPDTGFGIHPDGDDEATQLVSGGAGMVMAIKPFRNPRDNGVWVPRTLIRGREGHLPWMAPDGHDHRGRNLYSTYYGAMAAELYVKFQQGGFDPTAL